MGDKIVDDAQIVFEIETADGTHTAGGDSGKVILNDVTLTVDRPTNGYSGLGNEGEVAVGYGIQTASMDTEQMLNQSAAELLAELYNNSRSPAGISVIAEDVIEARATKFDWNNLEMGLEDDGDQTVSISGKIRGLDIEANP
jgi:hypothetical protein